VLVPRCARAWADATPAGSTSAAAATGLGSGRGKAGRAPRAAEAKSRLFYDQKMSPSYHLPRFRSFPWLLYSGRFGPRLVITHKPISWYGIIDNDAQNDTGCHAACCHVE